MANTGSRNLMKSFIFLASMICGILSWVPSAYSDAIARSITAGKVNVVPSPGGTITGAGAVATNGQVFDKTLGVNATFGDPGGPAFGTSFASDQVTIGAGEPVIGAITTTINGDREKFAIPFKPGGLAGGRKILYNFLDNADKVAGSQIGAPLTLTRNSNALLAPTTATSQATQTVRKVPNAPKPPTTQVAGTATASVANTTPTVTAIALGIINDPLAIIPGSLSDTTSLDVFLGNDDQLLSYHIGTPDQFALGVFHLGLRIPGSTTPEGLLTFTIGVDSSTGSVRDAINVLEFNPAVGFSTADTFKDYLSSPANDFFTFDSSTHTLSELTQIPLFHADLTGTDGNVVVTFDYEGIAGSAAVPEPSTFTLLGLGILSLLILYGKLRQVQPCHESR